MTRYQYDTDGRVYGLVQQDSILDSDLGDFFTASDVVVPEGLTLLTFYDYTYINGVVTLDPDPDFSDLTK